MPTSEETPQQRLRAVLLAPSPQTYPSVRRAMRATVSGLCGAVDADQVRHDGAALRTRAHEGWNSARPRVIGRPRVQQIQPSGSAAQRLSGSAAQRLSGSAAQRLSGSAAQRLSASNRPDQRNPYCPDIKKGGPGWDRPVIVPIGVDQKSLRYCSLPMKPSFVTAERLITASVWSTLSYFACGSGWKCSSGSGLIAAAVSRY